jgi:spore coat polysaccharide biosynthesis predicted glycosyltransferase SpsG/RimJ/RimL family protein N-acetyltransferase
MNISAREASIEDSMLVLNLRNQRESTVASRNSSQITKKEHESWYKNRVKFIRTQPFWIFEDSKKEIGYVRLEESSDSKNSFEISICLHEDLHGQGIGLKLLNQALNMLSINFASKRIVACIKSVNTRSIKIFKKAGFSLFETDGDFEIYEKNILPVRFVFRADASTEIGTGHVMRIFGLLEELVLQKYQVVFIGNVSEVKWVYEKIKALDAVKFFLLESEFTINKLTDILIIDSYQHPVNSIFLEIEKWKFVISFFDEQTPNYKASLKIHPGLRQNWPEISDTKIISGPDFIPFRRTISRISAKTDAKKLIITVVGGGIDKFNLAKEMAKIITRVEGDFEVNFFSNVLNSIGSDPRFNLFPIGPQLDLIGNKSGLVFTTASTTCLEFIARGCVVGICNTTENQKQYYDDLPRLGVAAPIGEIIDGVWKLDSVIIEKLIVSKEFRDQYQKKSNNLINLDGASRILNEIISL